MAARPQPKPKMSDRVLAWQYAFGIIQSSTVDTVNAIPTGYAAIAAAILTVGNVDIQDPLIAQVVDLMSAKPSTAQEEPDGNGA